MNSWEGTFLGGPQDGAKFRTPGCHDPLPNVVYSARQATGDRHEPWSSEKSARFPVQYNATTGGKQWRHIGGER